MRHPLRTTTCRAWRLGAIVASALTALACESQLGTTRRATPATSPQTQAAPEIEVSRVVQEPLRVDLSLPGELHAFQSVDIHPRVTGFVQSVAVDRGSRVRAGEVLATLDAPELLAQRAEAESRAQASDSNVLAARAKLDADQGTFERFTAAATTPGVVAGNDVALAEKAAEASRNHLAAAERAAQAARQTLASVRQLETYLRLTAPFEGIVTERNVHPGALVGPAAAAQDGRPLLRLIDQRRLRLVVPVPEAYTTEIQPGAALTFAVAAHPGVAFQGVVARVARSVETTTRTMAVELDVDNSDGRLAVGEFCQVQWPVRRPTPSLFVPAASIATTTNRTFVVRVRNGEIEWVTVRTGLTSGPRIEVFGDLQAGDMVAGRGTDELRPGAAVRVRESS